MQSTNGPSFNFYTNVILLLFSKILKFQQITYPTCSQYQTDFTKLQRKLLRITVNTLRILDGLLL